MSTKEKLIQAAAKYYSEYGDGFSLSQVAGELGIKKQSVYSYFKNKDELLLTMLNQQIDLYENLTFEHFMMFNGLDIKERLYKIGLDFITINSDKERVWVRKWLSITCRRHEDMKKRTINLGLRFESYFADIFNQAMQEGLIEIEDPAKVSTLYVIILRGIVDNIVPSTLSKNLDTYDLMFDHFWESIKK